MQLWCCRCCGVAADVALSLLLALPLRMELPIVLLSIVRPMLLMPLPLLMALPVVYLSIVLSMLLWRLLHRYP